MKKIPSLFMRDFAGNPALVTREPNPECAWVFAGEGRATRKWDGTACMVRDGVLYARYDAKHGKTPPKGFEAAQETPDAVTGHWPGWIPVTDAPQFRWHREAWACTAPEVGRAALLFEDGTYELVGPRVQSGVEGFGRHILLRHGWSPERLDPPREYACLAEWFKTHEIEGIVWHHPDGRMAKIKRTDFGLPWPVRTGP